MRTGRARHAPNRLASSLFLVGCLAVLGGTFMLGVLAGRSWPRAQPASNPAPKSAKETTPGRPGDRTTRLAEPAPTLTFYQELTAPLTAPPPPKPSKPARSEKSDATPKADGTPKADAAPTPELPGAASSPHAFTVQAGAYKAREPAEILRARLAAGGHDAYVVQVDAPGGVRFRVRVGTFATREAAQAVADRIGGDRSLSTFVTAR